MIISLIMTIYLSTGQIEVYSQPVYEYKNDSIEDISQMLYKYNACVKYANLKERSLNSQLKNDNNSIINNIKINCVKYDKETYISLTQNKIKKRAELLKTYASLYKIFEVLNEPFINK